MILKAYIEELPIGSDNEFKVRIPYLEGNSNNKVIYSALLCNQPGEYDGYKVGDCVIIGFEDILLDVPIILGKLFVGKEDVNSTHVVSDLTVTGAVDLPATTTIGGYSTVDIFKNYQKDAGTGTLSSNLDYDIGGEVTSGLYYDAIDTWPYDPSQEAYCDVWYLLEDVEYENYVG